MTIIEDTHRNKIPFISNSILIKQFYNIHYTEPKTDTDWSFTVSKPKCRIIFVCWCTTSQQICQDILRQYNFLGLGEIRKISTDNSELPSIHDKIYCCKSSMLLMVSSSCRLASAMNDVCGVENKFLYPTTFHPVNV